MSRTTSPASAETPGLAIVANCLTPYRVHLHRLIAAGIPELRLHTLVTHGAADFDWRCDIPDEIHASFFAVANESPVARLYDAPLREWRKGKRLADYLRRNDVRAVICGVPRYLSYLRVIRHCQRAGVPVFVNSDANIRNERSLSPLHKAVKARFHRYWLGHVRGVMSMGRLGDEYFRQYGVAPDRLYRVPYTPDYDAFAALDAGRLQRFRQRYGLCDGRRYLLFSGRLAPVKRVDLLIDAFVRLADERPRWDLVVAGDGPLGDALRRRVPQRLHARVIWTGFLEQADLMSAYHAADVLVLPSDREPWAVVVQEAMAAGLAIVASDAVGAAHELVEDGTSGRIFRAGDGDELTQALLDVCHEERIEMYHARSRDVLRNWRKSFSPVAEIRRALAGAGVLPDEALRPSTASNLPGAGTIH
jgi:glycosyltransferase involved in cell wall biosynthesis